MRFIQLITARSDRICSAALAFPGPRGFRGSEDPRRTRAARSRRVRNLQPPRRRPCRGGCSLLRFPSSAPGSWDGSQDPFFPLRPPRRGHHPRPWAQRCPSPPWCARAPPPPLGRPVLQGMGRQVTAQPGCPGMSKPSCSPRPTATPPSPPITLSFGPRSPFGSRERGAEHQQGQRRWLPFRVRGSAPR